jgi:dTDP-4-amino-4,6-dideoxygalactose transaminase
MSGCWARDTEAIVEWGRSRGVLVVEDCAQAQGLFVGGKAAGTFGDAAVYSSHGGKVIAGPGGGWVATRHPKLAAALAQRNFPPEPRETVQMRLGAFIRGHWDQGEPGRHITSSLSPWQSEVSNSSALTADVSHTTRGFQARRPEPASMSDIEAQLLTIQWPKVESLVRARSSNANRWRSMLAKADLPGLRLLPGENNVHTKVLLAFDGARAGETSSTFRAALWNAGVEWEDTYMPLHLRAPFHRFRRSSMPVTERLWRTAFAVPARPNLTASDWRRIETAVGEAGSSIRNRGFSRLRRPHPGAADPHPRDPR